METNVLDHVSTTTPQRDVEGTLGSTTPPRQPSMRKSMPLVQTKLTFKSIPREQWLARENKRFIEGCEERKDRLEHLKLQEARKVIERREGAKIRKRAERERRKQLKGHLKGLNMESVTLQVSGLLTKVHICASDINLHHDRTNQ
jgi:hypothetical protein